MAQALLRALLSRRRVTSLGRMGGGARGPCTARDDTVLLPFHGGARKHGLFASVPNAATTSTTGWSGSGQALWRLQPPARFFGWASSDHDPTAEGALLEGFSRAPAPEGSAGSPVSTSRAERPKSKGIRKKSVVDFTKVDVELLPTVILIGRPNVGKSALFNRLIRRREALVYNTPDDHVTRDIREGIAKLGDLRFRVLDSAGLETAASSGSILSRTTEMTSCVLGQTQFAIFLIDVRAGLQPLDLEVGKWLRRNAPGTRTILAMNKAESLDDEGGLLTAEAAEAHALGFGDPIAISAETGLGMAELYEALCPLLEDYMLQILNGFQMQHTCYRSSKNSKLANIGDLYAQYLICFWENNTCLSINMRHGFNNFFSGIHIDKRIQDDSPLDIQKDGSPLETEENKLPLQLAIVGRPNVGKSTLLNALLQEERVLVGPEAGLTRDSVRAQFKFDGRTIYLVDTAGWLQRCGQEKGPASLSVMQSRKNLLRAHVVALVLDAEEIAKNRCSMKHAETIIARQVVEEGRGLVVIVNKMDLLRGKQNSTFHEKVINAVPKEIQTVIPQVTGIPVLFVSALEGNGRMSVLHQIVHTYENWCLRLPTARLNRWLRKVMSRHSWKDQATQPKIKYFTQVKARPPTFVAFLSGRTQLSDSYIRFLMKSLVEDFNLGGIPIRVMQRSAPAKVGGSMYTRSVFPRVPVRVHSDKRPGTAELSGS